jgi:hypothetical protein
MVQSLPGEKWKSFEFKSSHLLKKKYMFSSAGRIVSFEKEFKKDGELFAVSKSKKYKTIKFYLPKGKTKNFLVHRIIAELFCRKQNPKAKVVVHLNHNIQDNSAANLKWVTPKEAGEHNRFSPRVKKAWKEMALKPMEIKKGKKLSLTQVIQIKKTVLDPKRKLTHAQIAEKFGISIRAVSRIKNGENWSLVKI